MLYLLYGLSPFIAITLAGSFFGWLSSSLEIGVIATGALLSLWCLYAFNMVLNGGASGRDPVWFPLDCWLQEASWNVPGGIHHKEQIVKRRVRSFDSGFMGSFTYEEIRDKELYREVALKVFPSPRMFWGRTLFYLGVGALLGWALSFVVTLSTHTG